MVKKDTTIEFVRGETLKHQYSFKKPDKSPQNLTGVTFNSQIRKASDDTLVTTFDFTIDNAGLGTMTASLSIAKTLLFNDKETYLYDMFMTLPGGDRVQFAQGEVKAYRRVTQI